MLRPNGKRDHDAEWKRSAGSRASSGRRDDADRSEAQEPATKAPKVAVARSATMFISKTRRGYLFGVAKADPFKNQCGGKANQRGVDERREKLPPASERRTLLDDEKKHSDKRPRLRARSSIVRGMHGLREQPLGGFAEDSCPRIGRVLRFIAGTLFPQSLRLRMERNRRPRSALPQGTSMCR